MTHLGRFISQFTRSPLVPGYLVFACLISSACTSVQVNSPTNPTEGAADEPGNRPNGDDASGSALAATGAAVFSSSNVTATGSMLACANCHAADGSGNIGPDIRGEAGNHLEEHAQGDGRHPAGVKFPNLTPEDFDAIAAFLGGPAAGVDDEEEDHEHDASLVGDAAAGRRIFATAQTTAAGVQLACAGCHANDGSGNTGPGIRGESGNHLREHAQGSGRHPEGVKFPGMTDQDFVDVAAFLAVPPVEE